MTTDVPRQVVGEILEDLAFSRSEALARELLEDAGFRRRRVLDLVRPVVVGAGLDFACDAPGLKSAVLTLGDP